MRRNHGLHALAAHDGGQGVPYSYLEFEHRAARARAAVRRREYRAAVLAAAAVVLALAAGLWVAATRPDAVRAVPPVAARTPAPVREITAAHWIATAPAEPVVVRVGSYAAALALEDRLAFIDDRLNDSRISGDSPVDPAALGRERVRLVNALASLRYAQALAANFQ